jgi:hypothetical protein
MEQIKRPGGTAGIGYYTSWDKSSENGCIYCGEPATTREHVPSNAFLVAPYPENLATIPACFECNNGFSEDEKYVACFLDVLKEAIDHGYTRQVETDQRLKADKKLKLLIEEQIKSCDGQVSYTLDENRLCRILIKLAKGHAGFEADYVSFDNTDIKVSYGFVFNMSEDLIDEFEEIHQTDIAPEIGSRMGVTPFVVQNIETSEAVGFMFWNDVQENQYRYQVLYDVGNVSVKIVICEMLYCKVNFD